jgi:hypothetical protein
MKILDRKIQFALLAVFLFGSSMVVCAQPGGGMQRFKDEKIKYFNEKLELSKDVAEKFWPVYEDLQNRFMKINEDEKSLLNYYSNNSAAMPEEEIDETISKFNLLQRTRGDLSGEYHDKFVELIGKRKTMKMYALEREFRMHILEKFRSERGHGKGGGPGRDRK